MTKRWSDDERRKMQEALDLVRRNALQQRPLPAGVPQAMAAGESVKEDPGQEGVKKGRLWTDEERSRMQQALDEVRADAAIRTLKPTATPSVVAVSVAEEPATQRSKRRWSDEERHRVQAALDKIVADRDAQELAGMASRLHSDESTAPNPLGGAPWTDEIRTELRIAIEQLRRGRTALSRPLPGALTGPRVAIQDACSSGATDASVVGDGAVTSPVVVREGLNQVGRDFLIPTTSTTPSAGGSKPSPASFRLDMRRLARIQQDDERSAKLLAALFAAADEPDHESDLVVLAGEHKPEERCFPGLDALHTKLLRAVVSRERWERGLLLDLAVELDLMLDGALEHLNDAVLDVVGDVLLFDESAELLLNGEVLCNVRKVLSESV